MPFYIYFIRYYYLFLTCLIVLVPLKYSFIDFLPSLLIMWMLYFCFKAGSNSVQIRTDNIIRVNHCSTYKTHDRIFYCFTLFMLIFTPLYIQFYTGGTITSAVVSFGTSTGMDSNYGMYQQYFVDNNLGEFTLEKLPYIILNGLSKILFWFFCAYYFAYNNTVDKKQLFCFLTIYLLFFLSGISRGTSFENFELLMITVFCFLARQKIKHGVDRFSKCQLVTLGIVVIFAAIYFIFSKSLRYLDYSSLSPEGPTSTLIYDSDSWIMSIAPNLGETVLSFSGYFIFPLYFTSELFWKVVAGSGTGILSFMIPFVAPYVYQDPTCYRLTLERMGVDCGACWNPDITTFIYYVGFPLLLFGFYYLGKIAKRQYYKGIYNSNIAHTLLLFIITYEMVSLPVGNFLVISSANKIALVVIIYLVRSRIFNKYMQR